MTTAALEAPADQIPVNGRQIPVPFIQTWTFKILVGLAGVCFISGLYYGFIQVHWYIPFTHRSLFWLKPDWDKLIHQPWWRFWRHGERDLFEGLASLLLGAKALGSKWKKHYAERLSAPEVILRLAGSLVLGFALIQGLLWASTFGVAMIHHALDPAYHAQYYIPNDRYAQYIYIASGIVIGLVVNLLVWAPAGRQVQLWMAQLSDDAWIRHNRTPAWIHYDLTPPELRERTVWVHIQRLAPAAQTALSRFLLRLWIRVVLPAGVLFVLGFIGWGVYARWFA